ncbi:MAG: hypothetical protein O6952_10765 [Planctomycetota bacterium]|nr:hypothetical protein [Planctomycetota bacterium]
MSKKKRKEPPMDSGFDRNVATAMPRSGKGTTPKTPWDVSHAPDPADRRGHLVIGAVPRYQNLHKGKSDVLDKIRDLKSELENSFASREEMQGRLEEADEEARGLKGQAALLKEEIEEHKKEAARRKDDMEAAERKARELEDLLERERAAKEGMRAELAEARLALDEIKVALQ